MRYASGRATIDIEIEQPTTVTTSEVALPGWRLELGWDVPAEGGRFVLRYRPPYLNAGLWIAASAIVLLLGFDSRRAFSRKRERATRGAATSASPPTAS